MYNPQKTANRIKDISKEKSKSISSILNEANLGKNTITKMSNGADIFVQSIYKIAECLECSVDYLLGRSDNPSSHKQVYTIAVDKQEQELLNIFRQLNENGQESIRNFANYTFDDNRYKKFKDIPKQA